MEQDVINLDYNVDNLFPTPLHYLYIDDFESRKQKLMEYAYDLREKSGYSQKASNKGGWQSTTFKVEGGDILQDLLLTVINNVLDNLDTADAVSPGLPVTDTLWEVIDEEVMQTKSRKNIWRAQTPQGFNFKKILDAHLANSSTATDDVEVATSAGMKVKVIHGSEKNIKITTAEDFDRVTAVLGY